jgi:hypothetical protein
MIGQGLVYMQITKSLADSQSLFLLHKGIYPDCSFYPGSSVHITTQQIRLEMEVFEE